MQASTVPGTQSFNIISTYVLNRGLRSGLHAQGTMPGVSTIEL